MRRIAIINTGVANIRSLQASFDRLGYTWSLTESGSEIETSEFCVLPGVGTYAAAMEMLRESCLVEPIQARIESNLPTLAVCLGLQLLCEQSEESPGVQGLGIIRSEIRRFPDSVQVPQLGWNTVQPQADGPFAAGQAYFANSFRLLDAPAGWGHATTDYAGAFVSSVWRGRVLACQFHPELSGAWGQQLLENWLTGQEISLEGVTSC